MILIYYRKSESRILAKNLPQRCLLLLITKNNFDAMKLTVFSPVSKNTFSTIAVTFLRFLVVSLKKNITGTCLFEVKVQFWVKVHQVFVAIRILWRNRNHYTSGHIIMLISDVKGGSNVSPKILLIKIVFGSNILLFSHISHNSIMKINNTVKSIIPSL